MTQQRRITPSGWLAIALAAYIILFGLAYEFFRNRPDLNAVTATPTTLDTSVESSENASSVALSEAIVTPTEELELTPELEIVTETILPATNPIDESLRAQISFPSNGATVEDADGWVQLQGQVFLQEEAERFFVVLESPSSNPPVIYPQQELSVSDVGEWSALVRYASPGQSYRTYVVSTSDATAVDALFSHEALAGLPNGFDIVSNVNVNSVAIQ